TIYLGIVATNTIGGKETIPLFDINNERFLEYDVARLIQSLSMTKKPVISILSSVNMDGGFAMDPQTGRPMQRRPWGIMRELKSLYDVRTLAGDSIAIPPETSTLLIVHPKKLTPKNQFAIDQWVLAGGRTIVFVDPIFEQDEAQPAAQGQTPDRSSNLENLFNAWGVQFST
ncbi:MAG: GldG family protein, partial [Phycisphaerae bacterium]